MPSIDVEILNLPVPKEYTGHYFRRSSASLLTDLGANITELKKHEMWKSTKVAEGYIDHYFTHKKAIFETIIPTDSSSATVVLSTSF